MRIFFFFFFSFLPLNNRFPSSSPLFQLCPSCHGCHCWPCTRAYASRPIPHFNSRGQCLRKSHIPRENVICSYHPVHFAAALLPFCFLCVLVGVCQEFTFDFASRHAQVACRPAILAQTLASSLSSMQRNPSAGSPKSSPAPHFADNRA